VQPFVIPALHARKNSQLLIRGASTSRLLQHIQAGNSVIVGITIVDGLVLAKTVFNQPINYRSVVLFGKERLIKNPDEKLKALEQFTKRIYQEWNSVHKPNQKERKATSIVTISTGGAYAKIRSGSPKEDNEDLDLPVWAGVLPIKQVNNHPLLRTIPMRLSLNLSTFWNL
jgi:nitroimidazol reductase NimA-like FMN-containing flavoprotein (pyridoxamine 5'-phosphate oxidase superfamily)